MTALATAFVQLRVDGSQVGPGIKSSLASPTVAASATKAGTDTGKRFSTGFGSSLKTFAAGALAGVGITTLISGFKDVVAEGREAAKATALTNAVIKSTGGVAGVTAAEVSDLAEALSLKTGVDDEVIASGENMLLTFTNVRDEVGKNNDIFHDATVTVQDMAAAFGGDAVSNSKLLGKALNDPVAGLTALTRVGVAFTAQQKEQIAAAVEHGDVLKAQKIILGELTKETAGAAESQASAGDKAAVAWANVEEELGTKLLPVLDEVLVWFASDGIDAIESFGGVINDEVLPPLEVLAKGIGVAVEGFSSLPGPVKEAIIVLGLAALATSKFNLAAKGAAVSTGLTKAMQAIHFQGLLVQESMAGATTRTAKFGAAASTAARGGVQAFASGVGKVTSLIGGAFGLALIGATTGIAILGKEAAATKDQQAQLNSITTTLTDTLKANTQAATEATYAALVSQLSDVVSQATNAGIALETIAGAAAGSEADFSAVASGLGLTNDELRQFVALAQSSNSRDQFGVFTDLTDDQTELVFALANSATGFKLSQNAARLSAEANRAAGSSASGAGHDAEDSGRKFAESAKGVEKATDALVGYRSVAATLLGRQIGLTQAILDARAALEENKDGFNKNTEAGVTNLGVVLDMANATEGFSGATEQGRKAIERMRGEIIHYATEQGKSAEGARQLAARLLGVKGAAEDVSGTPAKSRVSETGADETLGKLHAVAGALSDLNGRRATIAISAVLSYVQGAFNSINPFNADGAVYMAGGDLTKRRAQFSDRPIIWGEAGPEAYIPLTNDSRRPRALDLWKETGRQLGVTAMANGDVFTVGGLTDAKSQARTLEDMKDTLHESRDHLKELLASQRDLAQTISSGFDTTTYGSGAPSSARDLFVRARAEVNDAKLFRHVLNQLKAKGANPSLLAALSAAGPGAIVQAQALAGLSRKELNRYQRLIGAGNRAQDDIGSFVANQVYDDRIGQARNRRNDVAAGLDHLDRRLGDLPKNIGQAVAHALEGTSVNIDGRKVGEAVGRRLDRMDRGG